MVLLAIIAIASMSAGNILGLLQKNIKRLLAYSSTANLGYLLIALIAGGKSGAQAVMFYFVAYVATMLVAFGIITVLSTPNQEAGELETYRALYWRNPFQALALSIALFSLAGIPLTAGFTAKFYLLSAGIGSHLWLLAIVLVLNSAVGLFYYLRVTLVMASSDPDRNATTDDQISPSKSVFRPLSQPMSRVDSLALVMLLGAIVWLGVYPGPLIEVVQAAMRNFS
jgi:NADH-quinone oxidoreductase subunit N